ncbi:MAG: type II secretion system protein GspE [Clostridiales bacterium]|nr:MAG: type II secretion system protein GspE [Clostridiales bacterium]
MVNKKRIGDLLIEQGLISFEQLQVALEKQRELGEKLGNVLIQLDMISEQQLFKTLEIHFGIPYVDINMITIDPKVPKIITENLAKMHNLIPIKLEKGRLTVAMSDPLDMIAKEDISFATGFEIDVVVSPEQDIKRAIRRYYDASERAERAALDYINQNDEVEDEDDEESAGVVNSPMVRLVNTIIAQAIRMRASDIHVEPFDDRVRIRFRVDGVLREIMTTPINTHGAIVARIKIMGKMNISERRIPQDGRIETTIDGTEIDMRISVLPTVHGEKVVIRLLDHSNIISNLEELGFNEENSRRINKVLSVPEGIILATGPTGSGKTTTLYTLLRKYNQIDRNIITIENPVEYRLDGINQVQVNNKAGLTFSSGLRSILRQDPDIVMVGEIRDNETAQIAIRAAITGHIVLSTLHTNDTASTLTRLVDMGIENYLVATATVGILAQRLVKRVCQKCKHAYQASADEKQRLSIDADQPLTLWRGSGCNACNKTGYSGRIAIHEVMIVDRKIKKMMFQNESAETIKQCAVEAGMLTLYDSCKERVLEGVTTVDELMRVAYSID